MTWLASKERYQDKMLYRRCGKSGIKLPVISLGLWHNFGDVDVLDTMRNTLRVAFDNGITHFDLANNYGPPPGSAESNFGKLFKEDFSAYRDEILISSKAGYLMWEGPYGDFGSRKSLLASLDQSLKRMDLDYVDIFYSHRYDPETPLEETMGALHSAVQSGKALYVGISNYSPENAIKASKILKDLGTPCLIYQGDYSIFFPNMEKEMISAMGEHGIGNIVFSPLAQGLLTNRYVNGIPKDSRVVKSAFLPKKRLEGATQAIKKLNKIAEDSGRSLSQLAIQWVLRHSHVTSALLGASSVEQLLNNLGALQNMELDEDILNAIQQAVDSE